MSRLNLQLFGLPRLTLDEKPVAVERRKVLALLAYLGMASAAPGPEHPSLTREALAALLWPEHDASRASANLRHSLWEINQALGEGWVLADRETVGLNPQADVTVDVARFQALLAEARRLGWDNAGDQLTEAAALYQDHFLAGFSLRDAPAFDEWAFFHAEALRQELARALEALVGLQAARGRAEAALPAARRWLALDTLNEAAHRALMRLLAEAGQLNAALRQYQECVRLLRDELGEDPQPETTALYEQLRTQRPRSAGEPPARPAAPRHNLPASLTSFVGRQAEVAELVQVLSLGRSGRAFPDGQSAEANARLATTTSARLVTLTGPGGTGKTRLTLQAASQLINVYADGIWFVELAPVADAQFLALAAAAAVGLREETGRPILNVLVDFLRTREALLILDNCEHLVEECARFAETLLSRCPRVSLLASSREALAVPGELAVRVPPLSMPDPRQLPPADTLLGYDALRLFVERAAVAQPGFALTAENAAAVAQICRRLDGIPLAIELAAVRVTLMRVDEIAARLDDRFRLLTGGSRTAMPRHQTLRALIDWSYDLLSEPERALLRRLAAFAGGWTLEAAEAVCGDELLRTGDGEQGREGLAHLLPLPCADILDLLAQLVNKSLVIVEQRHDVGTRYALLETIRQYARDALFDSGEGELIRDRHLAYVVALSQQAERELTGPDQVAWLDRLEADHDNLHAALSWALERAPEPGLRVVCALDKFWEAHGYLCNGYDWLVALSAKVSGPAGLVARARVLQAEGCFMRSDFAQAQALASESLALYQQLGDEAGQAYALKTLGTIACLLDDYATGRALSLQSLALYRRLGDKLGQSEVLGDLGTLADHQDDERARAYLQESLALCRELGHLAGIADRLNGLGQLTLRRGDLKAARAWMEEGAALQERLGERGISNTLSRLGELALREGDFEQARRHYEASVALARAVGETLAELWSAVNLGYVALRQGDRARARLVFEDGQRRFREAGSKIGVVYALEGLASLAAADDEPARAVKLLAWADAMRATIGDARPPIEQVDVERDLARVQAHLDPATLSALQAEGRALTLEQAVDFALTHG